MPQTPRNHPPCPPASLPAASLSHTLDLALEPRPASNLCIQEQCCPGSDQQRNRRAWRRRQWAVALRRRRERQSSRHECWSCAQWTSRLKTLRLSGRCEGGRGRQCWEGMRLRRKALGQGTSAEVPAPSPACRQTAARRLNPPLRASAHTHPRSSWGPQMTARCLMQMTPSST